VSLPGNRDFDRFSDKFTSILRFTAMIAFVTKTFKELPEDTHASNIAATTLSNESTWAKDFKSYPLLNSHLTVSPLSLRSSLEQ